MNGTLYGVGVGPGDPELITVKALRILSECSVVAIPDTKGMDSTAYQIAKKAYPDIDKKDILLFPMPMTKDWKTLEENYQNCACRIEKYLAEGKHVAVLSLGDPTIYSTYIYMHRLVVADGYEAEIINGVPSFCAVSARVGDSLVDRNEELHIIPASYGIEDALQLSGTKVLMKSGSQLSHVKRVLNHQKQEVIMVENCGMDGEKIHIGTEEIPDEGSYFSILVIKDNTDSTTDCE